MAAPPLIFAFLWVWKEGKTENEQHSAFCIGVAFLQVVIEQVSNARPFCRAPCSAALKYASVSPPESIE
jgi:hypothetical protein